MGLKPGMTNNPAGRPAGQPNKITKELREILKSIVADELERLPAFIESLKADGADRAIDQVNSVCDPKAGAC